MGGSSQKQTSTTSSQPWGPAQGPLKDVIGQAGALDKAGAGYNYFPGSTVAQYGADTTHALDQIRQTAQAGSPLPGAASGQVQSLLQNGGLNGTQSNALSMLGDFYGQTDPNFEAALQGQIGNTAADVQRQFSGMGRLGSGADTTALTNAIGNIRTNALSNQFNSSQGQKLQALNAMMAGGQQGVSNVAGLTGLLPTLNDARFADANQLMGVGSAMDDQSQRNIQAQIDKWNYQQSAPWSLLGNYNNILQGAVGNYGSQQVTSPGGSRLGGALGGAIGGATAGSAFGPWGAGIGAIGGGLLGALK